MPCGKGGGCGNLSIAFVIVNVIRLCTSEEPGAISNTLQFLILL